jgi:hypothetical protein
MKEQYMTPENFTYFLQGYFEISGATYLSETQTQIVKDYLDLVFKKDTPDRSTGFGELLGASGSKIPILIC